jgi:hypothetical protein
MRKPSGNPTLSETTGAPMHAVLAAGAEPVKPLAFRIVRRAAEQECGDVLHLFAA